MARLRVLIADDHQMMRERIARLLSGDCEIVGAASNGQEAIELAEEVCPDIIILDISMPEMTGIEAAHILKNCASSPKILFLSNYAEGALVDAALQCGASGYVTKAQAAEELVPALQAIADGRTYFSPSLNAPTPK